MARSDGRYPLTGQRGGRPLKIHTIVDRDPDDRPVTAGEKVIRLVRAVWMPWEDSAATVGVSSRQLRDWRRLGGTARAKIAANPNDPTITMNERTLAAFVTDLEQAESEVHAAHLSNITNASKGGARMTKTVETVVKGAVKSVVTTTTIAAPSWQPSAWMLQHRRPDLYRTRHEFTGADGKPLSQAERAEAIGDWLEGYLQGVKDGAVVPAVDIGEPRQDL